MFTGEAFGICYGLHELTQGMDTEWLSFIPDFSSRTFNHGQVEWGIWFHHVWWSSCQKSLEHIHGTLISSCRVDAWAKIPLCTKFFPTGSCLGSSLRFVCILFDVFSPFAAFVLSYLKVSERPSRTLLCSSRAHQAKCMVLFNQTVRRRASGELSPSCFLLQNFSSPSFVKPSALFGRPPLPDSFSCFRFYSNAFRELSKILP